MHLQRVAVINITWTQDTNQAQKVDFSKFQKVPPPRASICLVVATSSAIVELKLSRYQHPDGRSAHAPRIKHKLEAHCEYMDSKEQKVPALF